MVKKHMLDHDAAKDFVARFGSPLYAYDLAQVEARVTTLKDLLPPTATLFYSLKANPLPSLAGALRELGCRAEISSPGELRSALDAGFAPAQMLYGGPGKTSYEIDHALTAGVTCFSCESWGDLARLKAAARSRQQRLSVLLRVNPAVAPQASLSMAGVASQFGFDEDQLLAGTEGLALDDDSIELLGIHVYYGTQMKDAHAILAAMERAIETAERIALRLERSFRVLDLGGGFPWPYAMTGVDIDLSELKPGLIQLAHGRDQTASADLWFESGRYLVASAGTLLTTVVDVKVSKGGHQYVVLDAGINHLGGMSGLGRIPRMNVSIHLLDAHPTNRDRTTATLVGPLCSPLDCIARNANVPQLRPGDLIAIPNVGAYGLSASLVHFLSRVPPVEVTYRGTSIVRAEQLATGYNRLAPNDEPTC